ncbi:FAD-dependent oxidoreductase [Desulfovibrio sp. OttesenSCG-928-I05]|nr:FAD-dependent oxidoreductase [Desulfovibrio sp. OttesenSCG-928-I05]
MSIHVVVIGAVAVGPKSASRFKRLMPEARVTMVDRSGRISYGGCGIPFFVSGDISRVEELQSTPYGTLRDAAYFKKAKGVDVLTRTEATRIDRKTKTVTVTDMASGRESSLAYDKLVIATGSSPFIPPIPGVTLEGISPATNLDEAEAIKDALAKGQVNNAVVVGGGFIGLEMAVALADMWGIPTTVVELKENILPGFLSPALARMAARDLGDHGVTVLTGESVQRFEGENGHVKEVVTDKRTIPADLVVMAVGTRPNTQLAEAAGLALGERNLILVDEYMRTSDPDIYAGGDCVAIRNQVTGKPFWLPLGSQANRQGRVIGTNLAGGSARFPGAVGSWGVKLFEESAAGAGITLEGALAAGFDAELVQVQQVDRAHYYPEHDMMSLEAVIDKASGRVLGVQGVCPNGDSLVSRINAVSPLIAMRGSVEDLGNLEVVYSPPFSSAMDVINVLGNVAENTLKGRSRTISATEFRSMWDERDAKTHCFLDARAQADAAPYCAAFGDEWLNIPQDQMKDRVAEIPGDKPIIVICNTGLRAYEAQRVLDELGFTDHRTVAGGLVSLNRMGLGILPKK